MSNEKKISPQFLEAIGKTCAIDTSKYNNILEAVSANRKNMLPPNQTVQQNVTTPPAPPVAITVDGYVLPADAMTLMMFVLCTELAKDKKIDAILKKFNFKFIDVNGSVIYPRNAKSRKQ